MSFNNLRVKPFTIEARFLRFAGAMTALFVSQVISGCGDLEYKLPPKPAVRATGPIGAPLAIPTGSEIVYGEGAAPANTAAALGSLGTPGQSEAERNRIARADLYYKLDWARTMLENHAVPAELRRTVDQGRTTMRGIPGDGGSTLLNAALSQYDHALELYEEQKGQQRPNPNETSGDGRKSAMVHASALSATATESPKYRVTSIVDDPWPVFRSANRKLQEAGMALGLSKDESGSFATDQFKKDPFEKNPFDEQQSRH